MPRRPPTRVPLDQIEKARAQLSDLNRASRTVARIKLGELPDSYGLQGNPSVGRSCNCPRPIPIEDLIPEEDGETIRDVRCQRCGYGRPEWDQCA